MSGSYMVSLEEGFNINCSWSASNVMANCGMKQISNFNFYVGKFNNAWDSSYKRGEELFSLFKKHAPKIVSTIVKSAGNYMLVLSDQMLQSDGSEPVINRSLVTRHLMNYIIANKIGSYSLGPVFRNTNYAAGASDIQSMVWVPPTLCKHIILPAPTPYNSRHKRDVTYATTAAAALASGIAKGKK